MDSPILYVAWFVLAVAVAISLIWLLPQRGKMRRFLSGRQPMPDPDFLAKIAAPPEQAETCLAIRKAMSAVAGVPDEMILPSDTLGALLALPFDGADLGDLKMALARTVGERAGAAVEAAVDGVEEPLQLTFGQFAVRLADACCGAAG